MVAMRIRAPGSKSLQKHQRKGSIEKEGRRIEGKRRRESKERKRGRIKPSDNTHSLSLTGWGGGG